MKSPKRRGFVTSLDDAFPSLTKIFLSFLKAFLIVNLSFALALEDRGDLAILHGPHLLDGFDGGMADAGLVLADQLQGLVEFGD